MKPFRFFFFLFLLPAFVIAQVDSTDFIVQNQMKQQRITGLSLAVVKHGKTIVNKGYGLANVEHKVAVNSETVFRLASISKQFFATAILKLQEEGKLYIEDPVHKFFTDAPETWKPIQLKHLLSHTSGLVREAPGYNNNKIQPDLDVIKSAYPFPLQFKTGEKYQYCNLGYFMLAEIITQVSGMHWSEYIQHEFLKPAGMGSTYLTEFHPVIPNRAGGYAYKKDVLMNADAMVAIRPSGGFLSTTTDMIKWDKVVTEQKMFLTKSSWEKLWQPFISTSANPDSKSFYGFGWMIDEYKGHKSIGHSGSNIGFKTHYTRFPDDGLSIIVLANADDAKPDVIIKALADYYFREK
jgi:CubicO group peptidase (beta-lactamase class C family)